MMFKLSKEWIEKIIKERETGMGYYIATVKLKNGSVFNQVVIDSGFITRIRGTEGIPFSEEEIENIIVTHDRWDFREKNK